MPCEICGHTVQKVAGCGDTQRTFWCPQCGSLLEETGAFIRTDQPSITKIVRKHWECRDGRIVIGDPVVKMLCFVFDEILEDAGVKRP